MQYDAPYRTKYLCDVVFFVYKTSIRRFLRYASNEHQDVEAAGSILSSELKSIRTDALMSVNRTDSLYATLLGAGADRINNARIQLLRQLLEIL